MVPCYNSSAWNMTQEDQESKKKKVLGTEAHACKLRELRQEDPWVRPAWTMRELPASLSNKLRLSLKKTKKFKVKIQ